MSQVKFLQSSNTFSVVELNENTSFDELPAKVYEMRFDKMRGFFLSISKDRFELPETVFGNVERRADKIINTYNDRSSSTGILMTGDKGSGKSMLAQFACNKLIDVGIPVILISQPFTGPEFNSIVNMIGNCVIMIDEFAKVYSSCEDEDPQESLLSLMDGTGSSKRMIIMTENKSYMINDFMLNRPGRIFYHFEYGKIEVEVITEYCEYAEVPEIIQGIKDIWSSSVSFSFDSLKAIVEDWKRYGGSVAEIVEDLNIVVRSKDVHYEVLAIFVDGVQLNDDCVLTKSMNQSPFDCATYVRYSTTADEEINNKVKVNSNVDRPVPVGRRRESTSEAYLHNESFIRETDDGSMLFGSGDGSEDVVVIIKAMEVREFNFDKYLV